MTIQCCKCNKVRSGGQWGPAHNAMDSEISHTYCPTCLDRTMDELRAEMVPNRNRNNLHWMDRHLTGVPVQ